MRVLLLSTLILTLPSFGLADEPERVDEWCLGMKLAGLALAPSGDFYVTSWWGKQVLRVSPQGVIVTAWGTEGAGPGEFGSPEDVAVGSDGSVYVVDFVYHRVERFTPDGAYILSWGSLGTKDGELLYPRSIEVDDAGIVYVGDETRIQKFTGDGEFLGVFDLVPTASDLQLLNGELYVASMGEEAVFRYALSGELLDARYKIPQAFGVAVDSQGSFRVTSPTLVNDVKEYSPEGTLLGSWGSEVSFGGWPLDLLIHEGKTYLAAGQCIRVYATPPTPVHATTWGALKSRY